jgi:hypothetical protein
MNPLAFLILGGVDVAEMLVFAAACADLTPYEIVQVRLHVCSNYDS